MSWRPMVGEIVHCSDSGYQSRGVVAADDRSDVPFRIAMLDGVDRNASRWFRLHEVEQIQVTHDATPRIAVGDRVHYDDPVNGSRGDGVVVIIRQEGPYPYEVCRDRDYGTEPFNLAQLTLIGAAMPPQDETPTQKVARLTTELTAAQGALGRDAIQVGDRFLVEVIVTRNIDSDDDFRVHFTLTTTHAWVPAKVLAASQRLPKQERKS